MNETQCGTISVEKELGRSSDMEFNQRQKPNRGVTGARNHRRWLNKREDQWNDMVLSSGERSNLGW